MGTPSAISFAELESYMRVMRIKSQAIFVERILLLDRIYLAILGEKTEKQKKAKSNSAKTKKSR